MEQLNIVALIVAVAVVALSVGFAIFIAEPASRDPDRVDKTDAGTRLGLIAPADSILLAGLSILFLLSGLHLTTGFASTGFIEGLIGDFEAWGYGHDFQLLVGWTQIAAAVLLILPQTGSWAAGVLSILMAGAIYTQFAYGYPVLAIAPIVLLTGLMYLAAARWPWAIGSGDVRPRRAEAPA